MSRNKTSFQKGNHQGREFQPGNRASRRHGIHAVIERGPSAIEEIKRGYFSELRQMVESQPGRRELRLDLAAMAQWLADAFFSRTLEELEDGTDLLKSPAAKRVGYHLSLASRILESIPDEDAQGDSATIILDSMGGADEQDT